MPARHPSLARRCPLQNIRDQAQSGHPSEEGHGETARQSQQPCAKCGVDGRGRLRYYTKRMVSKAFRRRPLVTTRFIEWLLLLFILAFLLCASRKLDSSSASSMSSTGFYTPAAATWAIRNSGDKAWVDDTKRSESKTSPRLPGGNDFSMSMPSRLVRN